MPLTSALPCCFRSVCIQGDNNRETEAWFSAFSKAMEVGVLTSTSYLTQSAYFVVYFSYLCAIK